MCPSKKRGEQAKSEFDNCVFYAYDGTSKQIGIIAAYDDDLLITRHYNNLAFVRLYSRVRWFKGWRWKSLVLFNPIRTPQHSQ